VVFAVLAFAADGLLPPDAATLAADRVDFASFCFSMSSAMKYPLR